MTFISSCMTFGLIIGLKKITFCAVNSTGLTAAGGSLPSLSLHTLVASYIEGPLYDFWFDPFFN